jgi:hemerythrin
MYLCPDKHPLPANLLTGNALVDDEHQRLCDLIEDLRAICRDFDLKDSCAGCTESMIEGCEARFQSCVAEFLGFICEHFRAEEALMKECGLASSQKKLFLSHVEDHANISDQAILLLAPKDRPKTVAQIARMASVLRSWLDLHIGTYDVMLRR